MSKFSTLTTHLVKSSQMQLCVGETETEASHTLELQQWHKWLTEHQSLTFNDLIRPCPSWLLAKYPYNNECLCCCCYWSQSSLTFTEASSYTTSHYSDSWSDKAFVPGFGLRILLMSPIKPLKISNIDTWTSPKSCSVLVHYVIMQQTLCWSLVWTISRYKHYINISWNNSYSAA